MLSINTAALKALLTPVTAMVNLEITFLKWDGTTFAETKIERNLAISGGFTGGNYTDKVVCEFDGGNSMTVKILPSSSGLLYF